MSIVAREVSGVRLLIAGSLSDGNYVARVRDEIEKLELNDRVSLLGERHDVPALLQACEIGILSSASEAFPLALMEYGVAGLPVVTTRVGQCAEFLQEGRAGELVSPGNPDQLAQAIIELLASAERRSSLARALKDRILESYDAGRIAEQLGQIYQKVLESRSGPGE